MDNRGEANLASTGLWKLTSYGKPRKSRAFPQDLENANSAFPTAPTAPAASDERNGSILGSNHHETREESTLIDT